MNLDVIRFCIKMEEGLRLKPYRCSKGHMTVGYGHKLTDGATSTPISAEVAEMLLEADLDDAVRNAQQFAGTAWPAMTDARQHALVDMAFNMGLGSLSKFKKLRAAVLAGEWERAAKEIQDSQYWRDVPNRARRNYERMLTGEGVRLD